MEVWIVMSRESTPRGWITNDGVEDVYENENDMIRDYPSLAYKESNDRRGRGVFYAVKKKVIRKLKRYEIYVPDSYCDEMYGETGNFTYVADINESEVNIPNIVQKLITEEWLDSDYVKETEFFLDTCFNLIEKETGCVIAILKQKE